MVSPVPWHAIIFLSRSKTDLVLDNIIVVERRLLSFSLTFKVKGHAKKLTVISYCMSFYILKNIPKHSSLPVFSWVTNNHRFNSDHVIFNLCSLQSRQKHSSLLVKTVIILLSSELMMVGEVLKEHSLAMSTAGETSFLCKL